MELWLYTVQHFLFPLVSIITFIYDFYLFWLFIWLLFYLLWFYIYNIRFLTMLQIILIKKLVVPTILPVLDFAG